MRNLCQIGFTSLFLIIPAAFAQKFAVVTEANFKDPPADYRPIAQFGGAGGSGGFSGGNLIDRLKAVYDLGYGGVMFAPSAPRSSGGSAFGSGGLPALRHAIGPQPQGPYDSPWLEPAIPGFNTVNLSGFGTAGTSARGARAGAAAMPATGVEQTPQPQEPGYLSQEYFEQVKQIMAYSKERGRHTIFYDEVGYPSGIANHTAPKELRRRLVEKTEETITGPKEYTKTLPSEGVLMAVVAMNKKTSERVNLTPLVKQKSVTWKAPAGDWKIMVFNCVPAASSGSGVDYGGAVDYLDPDAVKWFLDTVYEPHYRQLGEYFGNVLNQTFFDDVGIYNEEKTWTYKFNEKFKARFGKDPAIYYPALWEDIGPETEAARVALFDTRAEMLADGFPKVLTDWGAKHNLSVGGHPPGNYDIGPVDMDGDPFKYFRAQPIPMADSLDYGRPGFKLIGDSGDLYDKPVVASETFNGFQPAAQPKGYRKLMELYIRGITKPIGTSGSALATWADWLGRCSIMLQGGRRISEIAIFYPIAALEAFYRFDAPEYPASKQSGTFVPYDTDYLAIGEMLLNEVHRDYTLMHPDILVSEKVKVSGASLNLNNQVNRQSYKLLILPGERVISLKALQKIKSYYDAGGTVLATSLLPSKAAELAGNENLTLANDLKVQTIVKEMFGIDSSKPMPEGISAIRKNTKGGRAVFIRKPAADVLTQTIDKLELGADVYIQNNPTPTGGYGVFSYVHKNKEGRDIYFFANSSTDNVDTFAEVRGRIQPQLWNPHTGEVTQITKVEYVKKDGRDYTRFPLNVKPVSSIFVVGDKPPDTPMASE
jgi:hypothetical protein